MVEHLMQKDAKQHFPHIGRGAAHPGAAVNGIKLLLQSLHNRELKAAEPVKQLVFHHIAVVTSMEITVEIFFGGGAVLRRQLFNETKHTVNNLFLKENTIVGLPELTDSPGISVRKRHPLHRRGLWDDQIILGNLIHHGL